MAAGSTYTPIATATASGSVNSITFSSITGSYTDLVIVVNASLASGSNQNLTCQVNGDTGTNYSWTRLTGNGSTATSDRASNYGSIILENAGYLSTSGWSNYIINFLNYSNTTTYKTVINRANYPLNGTDACVNLWRNTNAITSINLYTQSSANFATGSTFTLYGITAA